MLPTATKDGLDHGPTIIGGRPLFVGGRPKRSADSRRALLFVGAALVFGMMRAIDVGGGNVFRAWRNARCSRWHPFAGQSAEVVGAW